MSPHRRLVLASVGFAVMWTAGMLWIEAPSSIAGVVIMMIAGAITGTLWYFAMRWFMNRYMRPRAWPIRRSGASSAHSQHAAQCAIARRRRA